MEGRGFVLPPARRYRSHATTVTQLFEEREKRLWKKFPKRSKGDDLTEKVPEGEAREQAAAVYDVVNQVSETGHLPDAVTGADGKSHPATGRGRGLYNLTRTRA